VHREVADPRREMRAGRTPVRAAVSRVIQERGACLRLADRTCDLVFDGALEEFEKLWAEHFVLCAREIDDRFWWGCAMGMGF
jgi:hypothetical protein